jgi:hypothetical protein
LFEIESSLDFSVFVSIRHSRESRYRIRLHSVIHENLAMSSNPVSILHQSAIAIEYALLPTTENPIEYLRAWAEGRDAKEIQAKWPDAPCFFQTINASDLKRCCCTDVNAEEESDTPLSAALSSLRKCAFHEEAQTIYPSEAIALLEALGGA